VSTQDNLKKIIERQQETINTLLAHVRDVRDQRNRAIAWIQDEEERRKQRERVEAYDVADGQAREDGARAPRAEGALEGEAPCDASAG
jgi:hypothetical protein